MIDALTEKFVGAFTGMSTEEIVMVGVGFGGQALFTMRFLIQWLKSEISRKSVIPIAFWYFSIAGGATLFVYALWRQDPVFILGQGTGLFIYSRNLWLIHREKRETEAAAREAVQ
ncbi:MAG: lipid-A-disaccharide synthase N-terminal domain-containing protein [Thalassobaculaceae bacterium]|nr:lipid-A-disaccharide synthase N-terminal domain-containing protein [Thalassobaculaceae bacterium]